MTKSSGLRGVRSSSDTIKRRLRAAVIATPAIAALAALTPSAQAVDLFWDINGATAGGSANTVGTGAWTAAAANWSTDAAGAVATQGWTSGNVAVFSAGTGVTGASTVTITGTQSVDGLRFEEGTVTITGGELNLNQNGVVFSHATGLTSTINSVVSGTNGMNISRAGTTGTIALTLGAANTYSGTTSIPSGNLAAIVTLNNNSALGTSNVVFGTSAGADLGALALPGNRIITNTVELHGGGQAAASLGQLRNTGGNNTYAGNIILNGTTNNLGAGLASIGGSTGTLTVTGVISSLNSASGANTAGVAWAKTGAGTVVLKTASPNMNGFVRTFAGLLVLEADGTLGTPSVDGAFDGGTLQLATNAHTIAFRGGFNYATAEDITTAGPAAALGIGLNGMGMLDSLSGTNTFSGDVRLGGASLTGPARVAASIGAQAGASLELAGKLYSSASGAGTAAAAPDAREIHKVGTGTVIITGDNNGIDGVTSGDADQYAVYGTMIIDAGSLVLKGANGSLKGNNLANFAPPVGSNTGAMDFVVNPATSLVLDNSTGVNTNRIAANASIALVGGEVKLIGNDTVSVNQAGGGLNVGSYSTITVDQPANTNSATTTFSLGTLNRTSRGTALLRGINGTTGFIGLSGTLKNAAGTPGTPTVGIIPAVVGDASATGNGTDFVTIDGGFARPLTAAEYTPLAGQVGLSDVVNTTVAAGSVNVTSGTIVNSIKLTAGNNLNISGGTRLLVKSGGLLGVGAGSSTIAGGTLSFEDSTIVTDGDTGETSISVISVEEGVITVPTGSSLAISSVVAGGEGITKSGGGTLSLSGANTYGQLSTGKTTINAGVLEVSNDAALGNVGAEVTLNGGTLKPTGTSSTSRGIELGSKARNVIEVGAGATYTVSGLVVSNAAGNGLVKTGPGTLDLTNAANSFDGGLRIEDGFMPITTNPLLPELGSGAITLAGGSLRTSVSGFINRNLVAVGTNQTGGFWIGPGATLQFGNAGTLAIGISGSGNIAVDGGGKLVLANIVGTQMTHAGRYYIRNGSTLEYIPNDVATGNQIAGIGSPPAGAEALWNLFDGSTLKFSVSQPTAASGFGGANAGIGFFGTGGNVEIAAGKSLITVGTLFGPGTLTKTGAGTLDVRAPRAAGNDSFSGGIVIADGIFSMSNQSVATNVESVLGTGTDATLGTEFMKIAGAGNFRPLFGSASLTLGAGRSIKLLNGAPTIGSGNNHTLTVNGAVVSDPSVTGLNISNVTSTGMVILAGASTYTGTTTVGLGTLRLTGAGTAGAAGTVVNNATFQVYNNNALNTVTGTGSTTIGDGTNAALVTANSFRQNVTVANGSKGGNALGTTKVSVIPTLTIAATGKFDINQGKLITNNAVGTATAGVYNGVSGEIQRAYNGGAFTGPGGLMTSAVTSTTSIGVTTANTKFGVGATGLFAGETVTGATTLAMYTYGGDANLDGFVSGDDYSAIDFNITTPGASGWSNGDFNYDGIISGDDYSIIDFNIVAQGAAFPTAGDAGGVGLSGVTAVPEPASLSVVALGAMSLLGRRRRK